MADVLGAINVAMAILGKPGSDQTLKAVVLEWPKVEPVNTDDLESPDNFETLFMTLPCAKQLLVDLQGAVDEVVSGKAFSDEE